MNTQSVCLSLASLQLTSLQSVRWPIGEKHELSSSQIHAKDVRWKFTSLSVWIYLHTIRSLINETVIVALSAPVCASERTLDYLFIHFGCNHTSFLLFCLNTFTYCCFETCLFDSSCVHALLLLVSFQLYWCLFTSSRSDPVLFSPVSTEDGSWSCSIFILHLQLLQETPDRR